MSSDYNPACINILQLPSGAIKPPPTVQCFEDIALTPGSGTITSHGVKSESDSQGKKDINCGACISDFIKLALADMFPFRKVHQRSSYDFYKFSLQQSGFTLSLPKVKLKFEQCVVPLSRPMVKLKFQKTILHWLRLLEDKFKEKSI